MNEKLSVTSEGNVADIKEGSKTFHSIISFFVVSHYSCRWNFFVATVTGNILVGETFSLERDGKTKIENFSLITCPCLSS